MDMRLGDIYRVVFQLSIVRDLCELGISLDVSNHKQRQGAFLLVANLPGNIVTLSIASEPTSGAVVRTNYTCSIILSCRDCVLSHRLKYRAGVVRRVSIANLKLCIVLGNLVEVVIKAWVLIEGKPWEVDEAF